MDRVFNAYKMRYQMLNEALLPLRASKKIKRVNIYINLDNFFHRLHSSTTDKEFQMYGKDIGRQLVGNILNLIGHYKHWAVKEYMQPVIYLYYSSASLFKNSVIIDQYRQYAIAENSLSNNKYFYINRAIHDAISIIPVVVKYLKNIYQIDSGFIEPSIIPYYMSQKNPADLHLIVTRDEYEYQYAYFDNWLLLRPNGDKSVILSAGNIWDYIQFRNKIETPFQFHPYTFLWGKTILGDKYRNIPKLTRTSWKTIVKYLLTVDNEDTTDSIPIVQQKKLEDYINLRKIKDTDFNHNLYCTSVKHQYDALQVADTVIIDKQLEDLFDINGLQLFCREMFKQTPINLSFLLTEAPSQYDEPHDKYFWEMR